MTELYPGQSEIVAGKLAQEEAYQAADRERLNHVTDPTEREVILRRIAGREGSLATRRRFLAELTGEAAEGTRGKVIRLRLADAEYEAWKSAAEAEGQTLSQYIRSRVG
jgi:hypothetical protein